MDQRSDSPSCLRMRPSELLQRWMRQKQDVRTLPEQERRTLRHELRPLYDWLVHLFDEGGA